MSDASEATRVEPDTSHQFQFGNEAWKAREVHGRPLAFESPEVLLDACRGYLKWNDENPLVSIEAVKFQGVGTLMKVPKMRAMSIRALCSHIGINRRTWALYRERDAFIPIVEAVEDAIFRQKFEGAAADMLNSSIIARELGLADKRELSGSVALTPIGDDMSLEEATRIYEANLKSLRDD